MSDTEDTECWCEETALDGEYTCPPCQARQQPAPSPAEAVEADESDGAFHHKAPDCLIRTLHPPHRWGFFDQYICSGVQDGPTAFPEPSPVQVEAEAPRGGLFSSVLAADPGAALREELGEVPPGTTEAQIRAAVTLPAPAEAKRAERLYRDPMDDGPACGCGEQEYCAKCLPEHLKAGGKLVDPAPAEDDPPSTALLVGGAAPDDPYVDLGEGNWLLQDVQDPRTLPVEDDPIEALVQEWDAVGRLAQQARTRDGKAEHADIADWLEDRANALAPRLEGVHP